jgi:hypothetical protein
MDVLKKELAETKSQLAEATKAQRTGSEDAETITPVEDVNKMKVTYRQRFANVLQKPFQIAGEAGLFMLNPVAYGVLRLGHKALRKTPGVNRLYLGGETIGKIATQTRDGIAKIPALAASIPVTPLMDMPVSAYRGFRGLKIRKAAGPIGAALNRVARLPGYVGGWLYQPGKEKTGLIDWAWEKGWERIYGGAKVVKDVVKGVSETISSILDIVAPKGAVRAVAAAAIGYVIFANGAGLFGSLWPHIQGAWNSLQLFS